MVRQHDNGQLVQKTSGQQLPRECYVKSMIGQSLVSYDDEDSKEDGDYVMPKEDKEAELKEEEAIMKEDGQDEAYESEHELTYGE